MSVRKALAGSLLAGSLMIVFAPAAARVDKPLEPPVVWEAILTLEWETGERKGQPVLRGYLVNTSPYPLVRIRPFAFDRRRH